jgi:hypothetical protein
MDAAAKRTRASDETCLGALRIVAREGWLCKAAWRISRAVHAFAKTRALLSQRCVGTAIDHSFATARRVWQHDSSASMPEGARAVRVLRRSTRAAFKLDVLVC